MLTPMRRLAMGGTALLIVVDVTLFAAATAFLAQPPRTLTAQRVFELARPATVLVQAHFHVKVSLPDTELSSDGRDRLTSEVQHLVDTRQVAYTPDAVERAAVDLVLADPGGYITAAQTRSIEDDDLISTGSGFFVTETGYLVTASHVVAPSTDDVRSALLDFGRNPRVEDALKTELADSVRAGFGISPTDAQLASLLRWSEDFASRYASIESVDTSLYVATGTVLAGSALEASGARARVVAADQPYPARDVALLKADVGRVPALALAPGEARLESPAYVVGYPRFGYLDEQPAPNQTVPVAFAQGRSATRAPHADFTSVCTTAEVGHGDSGGPVLDPTGRVVGMMSYAGFAGGSDVGEGCFVPASAIRDRLAASGVQPGRATLTADYRRALGEGDSSRYRPELSELESIHRSSPWDAYVAEDISSAQSAVLSGQDRTPPDLCPYVPAALAATAALAAVLLVLTAATLATGRRRRAGP